MLHQPWGPSIESMERYDKASQQVGFLCFRRSFWRCSLFLCRRWQQLAWPCLSYIWPSAWGLPNLSCIQLLPGRHAVYLEDVDRCRCRGDSRDDSFDSRHTSSHADPNAFDLCLGIFWPMGIASWLQDGGCTCFTRVTPVLLKFVWWRLCSRVVPWRNYHSVQILLVARSNLSSWSMQTWHTYDWHWYVFRYTLFVVTLFHPSSYDDISECILPIFRHRNGLQITWSEGLARVGVDWSLVSDVWGKEWTRQTVVVFFGQQSQFKKSTKDHLNLAYNTRNPASWHALQCPIDSSVQIR